MNDQCRISCERPICNDPLCTRRHRCLDCGEFDCLCDEPDVIKDERIFQRDRDRWRAGLDDSI